MKIFKDYTSVYILLLNSKFNLEQVYKYSLFWYNILVKFLMKLKFWYLELLKDYNLCNSFVNYIKKSYREGISCQTPKNSQ